MKCEEATRNWSPCDRMCSKAKAQRKEVKAEADAKEAKKQQKQAEKFQKATQANAQRLLRAIDAAGLADDAKVQWRYYDDTTAGTIRKYAAGDFENSGSWYGPRLDPEGLTHPIEVAKQLGCSADYLLGLTDELKPAAAPPADGWIPLKWIPGQEFPQKDKQLAVALFKAEGADHPIRSIVEWNDSIRAWRFPRNGATIDAKCVGWFPLPAEEGASDADA